jgi:hypothetical protein
MPDAGPFIAWQTRGVYGVPALPAGWDRLLRRTAAEMRLTPAVRAARWAR